MQWSIWPWSALSDKSPPPAITPRVLGSNQASNPTNRRWLKQWGHYQYLSNIPDDPGLCKTLLAKSIGGVFVAPLTHPVGRGWAFLGLYIGYFFDFFLSYSMRYACGRKTREWFALRWSWYSSICKVTWTWGLNEVPGIILIRISIYSTNICELDLWGK